MSINRIRRRPVSYARPAYARPVIADEPPSPVAGILKTAGLIAGLVVLTIGGIGVGILIVRKPAVKPMAVAAAPDPDAIRRAEDARQAADKVALQQAKEQSRILAERREREEYAAFAKSMKQWVRASRTITLLLRGAPSPPYLHRNIREAADKLADARKLAWPHVEKGPDGPVGKRDDVIGMIWVRASAHQSSIAISEELAELYMSGARQGMIANLGPLSEMIALVGRVFDDSLDMYEDLLKQDFPTAADVQAAFDRDAQKWRAFHDAVKEFEKTIRR